ncbi:MAG: SH3 domain-containing protein [Burkholderiales bacterium]|nr:SH3 domain-containing protein [Anaerolineae bacterium]
MFTQRWKRTGGLALFACLMLTLAFNGLALAQTPPVPVTMGAPQLGEVSETVVAPRFSFTIDTPQSVTVQALAVIPGFVPSFNVYDPSGALVQSVPNATGTGIVEAPINLTAPGTYVVEVMSVTGNPGPFVLSVIGVPPAAGSTVPSAPPPSAPLSAAIALPSGQALPGNVNPQAPPQLYTFSSSATDVLVLTVRSDAPTSGQTVTLRNATSGVIVATSGPELIAVRYNFPMALAAFTNYEVEVAHGGSAAPESYIICLELENNQIACSGAPAFAAPVATTVPAIPEAPPVETNAACMVVASQNVNVRSGPNAAFNVVETLFSGSSTPVIGQTAEGAWYQVTVDGRTGWVAAAVVGIEGNCSLVPVVAAPQPPPAQPTAAATIEATAPSSPPKGGEVLPTEESSNGTELQEPNGTEESGS